MLGIWFSETKPLIMGRQPVPTEFVEKKIQTQGFQAAAERVYAADAPGTS